MIHWRMVGNPELIFADIRYPRIARQSGEFGERDRTPTSVDRLINRAMIRGFSNRGPTGPSLRG